MLKSRLSFPPCHCCLSTEEGGGSDGGVHFKPSLLSPSLPSLVKSNHKKRRRRVGGGLPLREWKSIDCLYGLSAEEGGGDNVLGSNGLFSLPLFLCRIAHFRPKDRRGERRRKKTGGRKRAEKGMSERWRKREIRPFKEDTWRCQFLDL